MISQVEVPTPPPPPEIPEIVIPDIPSVYVQSGPTFDQIAPLIAVVTLLIVGSILLFPLIRAWARRIEGKGADPELRAEVEELRARLAEVEQQQLRLSDLEDRLDFAERLLSQQRASDRIGPA